MKKKTSTHENLEELEKAVETLACLLIFPQHFSFFQTSTHASIFSIKQLDYELKVSTV